MAARKYRPAPRPATHLLRERDAVELMRTGSLLVHAQGKAGADQSYSVIPGGAVSDQTAARLMAHPFVASQHDGLFPGHTQTWKMKDTAR